MILRSNARLLNPMKTSHCSLEGECNAALAEVERYGANDATASRRLARAEEAIRRRAAGHIAYLLGVAERRRAEGDTGAEYFEQRAAEVARHLSK